MDSGKGKGSALRAYSWHKQKDWTPQTLTRMSVPKFVYELSCVSRFAWSIGGDGDISLKMLC